MSLQVMMDQLQQFTIMATLICEIAPAYIYFTEVGGYHPVGMLGHCTFLCKTAPEAEGVLALRGNEKTGTANVAAKAATARKEPGNPKKKGATSSPGTGVAVAGGPRNGKILQRPFLAGDVVLLQGLQGRAELNGLTGSVLRSQVSETGPDLRYQVSIWTGASSGTAGPTLALKSQNLFLIRGNLMAEMDKIMPHGEEWCRNLRGRANAKDQVEPRFDNIAPEKWGKFLSLIEICLSAWEKAARYVAPVREPPAKHYVNDCFHEQPDELRDFFCQTLADLCLVLRWDWDNNARCSDVGRIVFAAAAKDPRKFSDHRIDVVGQYWSTEVWRAFHARMAVRQHWVARMFGLLQKFQRVCQVERTPTGVPGQPEDDDDPFVDTKMFWQFSTIPVPAEDGTPVIVAEVIRDRDEQNLSEGERKERAEKNAKHRRERLKKMQEQTPTFDDADAPDPLRWPSKYLFIRYLYLPMLSERVWFFFEQTGPRDHPGKFAELVRYTNLWWKENVLTKEVVETRVVGGLEVSARANGRYPIMEWLHWKAPGICGEPAENKSRAALEAWRYLDDPFSTAFFWGGIPVDEFSKLVHQETRGRVGGELTSARWVLFSARMRFDVYFLVAVRLQNFFGLGKTEYVVVKEGGSSKQQEAMLFDYAEAIPAHCAYLTAMHEVKLVEGITLGPQADVVSSAEKLVWQLLVLIAEMRITQGSSSLDHLNLSSNGVSSNACSLLTKLEDRWPKIRPILHRKLLAGARLIEFRDRALKCFQRVPRKSRFWEFTTLHAMEQADPPLMPEWTKRMRLDFPEPTEKEMTALIDNANQLLQEREKLAAVLTPVFGMDVRRVNSTTRGGKVEADLLALVAELSRKLDEVPARNLTVEKLFGSRRPAEEGGSLSPGIGKSEETGDVLGSSDSTFSGGGSSTASPVETESENQDEGTGKLRILLQRHPDWTNQELGKELGVSKEAVKRLKRKAGLM